MEEMKTGVNFPGDITVADVMNAVHKQASEATRQYEGLAKKLHKLSKFEEKEMADSIVPVMGGDGLFGGSGNGLIGGLILGSLLRNNGGLFNNDGIGGGGVATQGGVQAVVNASTAQQELSDIKASIPYNEAQVQLALAGVQNALTAQINSNESASATRDSNMQSAMATGFGNQNLALASALASITRDATNNALLIERTAANTVAAVKDDGDKTRALITHQYEATLNRQLSDANAQIIALQNKDMTNSAVRGVEVNTTNNINQMQQQQQQQQQFAQLANLVWSLGQQIRSTNEAINVGSGTMTANPTNTNTNIR